MARSFTIVRMRLVCFATLQKIGRFFRTLSITPPVKIFCCYIVSVRLIPPKLQISQCIIIDVERSDSLNCYSVHSVHLRRTFFSLLSSVLGVLFSLASSFTWLNMWRRTHSTHKTLLYLFMSALISFLLFLFIHSINKQRRMEKNPLQIQTRSKSTLSTRNEIINILY